MKEFAIVLFFSLLCKMSFAQSIQVIDSLKHQLVINQPDSSRVLILAELTLQYRNINPDSILKYGRQALQLAKESHFLKGEVRVMAPLGSAYRQLGNYSKAFAMGAFQFYQVKVT